MLERLEAERDRTATAVLKAQEGERARLARDLHDEANQALTGVLLRLEATAHDAPPALRAELRETQGVATQAMDELVRLARELRPGRPRRPRPRCRPAHAGRRVRASRRPRDAPEHPGRRPRGPRRR
jgi:signal transduction histidine kinase